MGKIVNYDNRRDYIVKGVVEEPMGHAHFQFDMFMAQNDIRNVWMSNNFNTYVKLKEGVDFNKFETEMKANFMKKIEPDVERFLKITVAEFLEQGNAFEYQLKSFARHSPIFSKKNGK